MAMWRKTLFSTLALILLQHFGAAQAPGVTAKARTVTRDAAGLSLLQNSIAAMGGSGSAATILSVQVAGHLTSLADVGNSTKQFSEKYKLTGASVSFRKELTSDKGTTVFASGGDHPVFQTTNQKSRRFGKHVATAALPFDVPVVMLSLAVGNPQYQIKFVTEKAGSPLHLQLEDETSDTTKQVTTQDWYFDPSTSLPVRVVYKLPDVITPAIFQKATCDYLGFQNAGGGVLAPSQMRVYEGEQLSSQVYIDSVQFNTSFATDFDMAEEDNQ